MGSGARVEVKLGPGETIRISPRRHATLRAATDKIIQSLEMGNENSYVPYTPEEADQAVRRGELLGQRNIISVGYGLPLKDGELLATDAIVIGVVKKTDAKHVDPNFLADRVVRRATRTKARVDVVEMGNPEAL